MFKYGYTLRKVSNYSSCFDWTKKWVIKQLNLVVAIFDFLISQWGFIWLESFTYLTFIAKCFVLKSHMWNNIDIIIIKYVQMLWGCTIINIERAFSRIELQAF